jgi:rubrerythrin
MIDTTEQKKIFICSKLFTVLCRYNTNNAQIFKEEFLMKLEGSRTEQNLRTALANEAIARDKYLSFAEKAKAEGQEEIEHLFKTMSVNEATHAQLICRHLHGVGRNSVSNLKEAITGEHEEWTDIYPRFADIAESEGFEEIAELFRCIAKIERDHEYRFQSVLNELTESRITDSNLNKQTEETSVYVCLRCGTVYESRPDECEVCHGRRTIVPTTYHRSVNQENV